MHADPCVETDHYVAAVRLGYSVIALLPLDVRSEHPAVGRVAIFMQYQHMLLEPTHVDIIAVL